jgi:hypothetical protein
VHHPTHLPLVRACSFVPVHFIVMGLLLAGAAMLIIPKPGSDNFGSESAGPASGSCLDMLPCCPKARKGAQPMYAPVDKVVSDLDAERGVCVVLCVCARACVCVLCVVCVAMMRGPAVDARAVDGVAMASLRACLRLGVHVHP